MNTKGNDIGHTKRFQHNSEIRENCNNNNSMSKCIQYKNKNFQATMQILGDKTGKKKRTIAIKTNFAFQQKWSMIR